MSATNLYGRIVTGADCEQAIIASLKIWLDGAIGELERLQGYTPNQIVRPKNIITGSEFERMPEVQLPCVLVIDGGLAAAPTRRDNGTYDAKWLIGVAPIVSDVDQPASRALAMAYAGAVRTSIVQHKLLKSPAFPGGFATGGVRWRDETYQDIPFEDTRSLAAARVIFEVSVFGVSTEYAGPRTPPVDPTAAPGDWPNATEVEANANLSKLTGVL